MISVIVPVFNQWQLVPVLLEGLSRQSLSRDEFEVLLVDNELHSETLAQRSEPIRVGRVLLAGAVGNAV
mgnify:CR=1 FL=1